MVGRGPRVDNVRIGEGLGNQVKPCNWAPKFPLTKGPASVTPRSYAWWSARSTGWRRPLDLNRRPVAVHIARGDDEIPPRRSLLSPHDLSDGSDGIYDRRAGGVRRERGEHLQDTAAVWAAREREHVRTLRLEPGHRRLQHLHQPLVEERDASGRGPTTRAPGLDRQQRQLRHLTGDAQRLQILRAVALRHGSRYVHERLRSLTDLRGRDDGVRHRVDGHQPTVVLETDVHAGAVAGGPDAVRQPAHRNGAYRREVVGPVDPDQVEPADGHVGERAARAAREVDVIGDRPRVDDLQHRER